MIRGVWALSRRSLAIVNIERFAQHQRNLAAKRSGLQCTYTINDNFTVLAGGREGNKPHLNFIISAKTYFQISSHLQLPGVMIWTYLQRWHSSTHNREEMSGARAKETTIPPLLSSPSINAFGPTGHFNTSAETPVPLSVKVRFGWQYMISRGLLDIYLWESPIQCHWYYSTRPLGINISKQWVHG